MRESRDVFETRWARKERRASLELKAALAAAGDVDPITELRIRLGCSLNTRASGACKRALNGINPRDLSDLAMAIESRSIFQRTYGYGERAHAMMIHHLDTMGYIVRLAIVKK